MPLYVDCKTGITAKGVVYPKSLPCQLMGKTEKTLSIGESVDGVVAEEDADSL